MEKNLVYREKRGLEIQELWDLMGNIVNNNLIKSINCQFLSILGGYDSKAPQVLYGQTIALAHGPPEVQESCKRYFSYTKIRFVALATKIFKNNRGGYF